jgi:hypothetical protein
LTFHTPSSAIRPGTLFAAGVSRKCRSMSLAPARNARKASTPIAQAAAKPTADQTEKRPPTQSHSGRMSEAPKARAACVFAVTA